jgi:hypothetical protein
MKSRPESRPHFSGQGRHEMLRDHNTVSHLSTDMAGEAADLGRTGHRGVTDNDHS